ncbi:MAG: acyl carrier protein [Acidobacteriota bacterium]
MNDKQKTGLDVVAGISGRPATELTPELNLLGDLGIDSPKALNLLLQLEEALGIEISDEDAAKMDTVGDILDYLGALA